MRSKIVTNIITLVVLTTLGITINSCSNGTTNNTSNGHLAVNYIGDKNSQKIHVTKGSKQKVMISLVGSSNVQSQIVNISLSNPQVATASPAKCSLSSGSELNSSCIVTINGLELGTTALVVSSSGYQSITIPTITQAEVTFGFLQVKTISESGLINWSPASAIDGQSSNALTVYNTSSNPNQLTFSARIVDSSGITESNSAVLNFSTTAANINPQASSCIVTSQNDTCNISYGISTPYNSVVFNGTIAGAVLAGNTHRYNSIQLTESPVDIVSQGNITVTTQNGNFVPVGMRAPIFVNWNDATVPNQMANVTLSVDNPQTIQFYQFNESGIETTSSTVSCNIYSSPIESTSCGFGVKQIASSGSATINATITGVSISQPEPLILTVDQPESAIRKIKFLNNSISRNIYVGITQGGANAFASNQANSNKTTSAKNTAPGAGSMCGTSNPRAACPVGSTCRPGGAVVESTTPQFCYWDVLKPYQDGSPTQISYLMTPGESVEVRISGSSVDPNGIIWSGNLFARTNCNESGVCEVGSCGSGTDGLMCAPATGAAGGVLTLGEFTFQTNSNPDYYDVSIINGVNFAMEFGPNQSNYPFSTASAYSCGTAGSSTVQGSWPSNNGLPASAWNMQPTTTSFPNSTVNSDPAIYYSWVSTESNAQLCSSESCINSEYHCGYRLNSAYSPASGINQGTSSNYQQYCGKRLAWLTTDSIAGFNQTTNNGAASTFSLNTNWANPVSGSPTIYVTNLQLCNINTFSSFQNPAPAGNAGNSLLACGGTTWPSLTRAASGFTLVTDNVNWDNYVEPTIAWLKSGCPTCYTYPFDDPTSTFTCTMNKSSAGNPGDYIVKFSDLTNF